MKYVEINESVSDYGLAIYGGFHGDQKDNLPKGFQTLLMLGPSQTFWEHFKTTPEFNDGNLDPIDRWSDRIVTELASKFNALPFLPFAGPPYAPFLTWALKTGRAWSSPVGMLVHDTTGLMVSFRGALAFQEIIDLPNQSTKPCFACEQPCKLACPVNALSAVDGYNTKACHDYLETPEGQTCLTNGCLARQACPASLGANRTSEQSAHHMSYFHKA